MVASLFKTQAEIKRRYVISQKDEFSRLSNGFNYYCYRENGGTIEKKLYYKIVILLFVTIAEFIVSKGCKLEIPFFGQIYLRKKYYGKGVSLRRYRKRKNVELVFDVFEHANENMKLYNCFFPERGSRGTLRYDKDNKTISPKIIGKEKSLEWMARRDKRKNEDLTYFKEVKKKNK